MQVDLHASRSIAILLPLASSVVYVLGALLLKRAADLGADVWRTVRACNCTTALLFLPLLARGDPFPVWTLWWQPVAVAVLFMAGQVFSLMALNRGDVSVATPVLGLKIPMVALLTTALLGERIGLRLWLAALMSSTAIALLNATRPHPHQRVGATILLATVAAGAYALFDVLVQKWASAWGTGNFLPILMACAAGMSIILRPRAGVLGAPGINGAMAKNADRTRSVPARAHTDPAAATGTGAATMAVRAGAVCFALQALMFVMAIAIYRQATVANVLYGSRGLWSVLAVWLIGHWFSNREQDHGPRILLRRLAGAILMFAAIWIVLTPA
jgi:hypothetical protein